MKKTLVTLTALATLGTLFITGKVHADSNVYRLYNPNTGEHFYTTEQVEKTNLQNVGWWYEGVGWQAPDKGQDVYRLYNPNAQGGDHYYTLSAPERDHLVSLGWHSDGVTFQSGGAIDVDVAYNPNAHSGAHNYTTSKAEQDNLLNVGWKFGNTAFKASGLGFADGINITAISRNDFSSLSGNWSGTWGDEGKVANYKDESSVQIQDQSLYYTRKGYDEATGSYAVKFGGVEYGVPYLLLNSPYKNYNKVYIFPKGVNIPRIIWDGGNQYSISGIYPSDNSKDRLVTFKLWGSKGFSGTTDIPVSTLMGDFLGANGIYSR
jgi:hypothetical protein